MVVIFKGAIPHRQVCLIVLSYYIILKNSPMVSIFLFFLEKNRKKRTNLSQLPICEWSNLIVVKLLVNAGYQYLTNPHLP